MLLIGEDRFVWGIVFPAQNPKKVHMILDGLTYIAEWTGCCVIAAPLSAFLPQIEKQRKLGFHKHAIIDDQRDIREGRLVLGIPTNKMVYN